MKAKYKLGNLVQVSFEDPDTKPFFGLIEGVLLTKSGAKYRVEELDDDVSEDQVVETYRAIKPRAEKTKPPRRKTASKENSAHA